MKISISNEFLDNESKVKGKWIDKDGIYIPNKNEKPMMGQFLNKIEKIWDGSLLNDESDKWRNGERNYWVQARLKQFSAKGLCKINFLKICLAVSLKTKRPDLFEMNFAFAAVDYHWSRFGLLIHVVLCMLYARYIVCVFTLNILIHDTEHIDASELTMLVIIIILSCGFWGCEFMQIIANSSHFHVFQYCTDYIVGWIAYFLTLAGSILRLYHGKDTKASAGVMAAATVFVFLKGLDFLRPFELTGPTIRIVYAILYRILPGD